MEFLTAEERRMCWAMGVDGQCLLIVFFAAVPVEGKPGEFMCLPVYLDAVSQVVS